MSVIAATRYRLDDLRRAAASMASKLGVAPARASALASHLLWFDAAGASIHGIATLPDWLGRLERKDVDPAAEGRARRDHAGTAVFEAGNGLAPLALARAGEIAAEKARDTGIGIVRISGLGPSGPPAPVAAELAVGPFLAAIVGPGGSLTLAVPMPEGLPALYDPALAQDEGDGPTPGAWSAWAPWTSALAGGDGWAILALAIPALEPLATFHERAADSFRGVPDGPGTLRPDAWEARRREARERGVSLDEAALAGLRGWSDRLDVPWPAPSTG